MTDGTPIFDPMIYDALLELETRISGRYLAWVRQEETTETKNYWRDKARTLYREVHEVDSFNESQIQAKRQELRELWRSMPVDAPRLTA